MMSVIAASPASLIGCQNGAMTVLVPRRTFVVRRARSARLMNGLGAMVKSMQWCSPVQMALIPPRSAISQSSMYSS